MADLKLISMDAEDLAVFSAHLQDAVISVGDMAYLKPDRRFALVANRFDWEHAAAQGSKAKSFARRRTGVRFEHVNGAQVSGIDLTKTKDILSLLAIEFEPAAAPSGYIILRFSGGAAIRLEVDCIEAELTDLGAAWATTKKPGHEDPQGSKTS